MYRIISIDPIAGGRNVKASVQLESPHGNQFTCSLVKQPLYRAYLEFPIGLNISKTEKRRLSRQAGAKWATMVADTLEGLLDSEKVFLGGRFKRLGVQLKVFCPECDRYTKSKFFREGNSPIRNRCEICGTRRPGKPNIGAEEVERIQDKRKAVEM